MPDTAPLTGPRDAGAEALTDALSTSFRLLRIAMAFVVAFYLFSGVFVVRQDEKAVVLRFGRVDGLGAERVKGPGLHWTWPKPVCEVVRIPTEKVQSTPTKTFWYAESSEFQSDYVDPGASLRPGFDGCGLSADANLIHSRWAVRYTIADPERVLFVAGDLPSLIRCELDRAVVHALAGFTVDRALRTEIESLRDGVEAEVRRRLAELDLGVRVQGVDVLGLVPPRQVAQAFDAVTSAEQERSKLISEANAYGTGTVLKAQGEAARLKSEGEAYRRRIVSEVEAQASYFEQVREKYVLDRNVVWQSLLQDGIRRALSQVEHKYIVHGTGANSPQIRLQLGGEQKPPRKEP
jgi:modulator of FtsH protease HflK